MFFLLFLEKNAGNPLNIKVSILHMLEAVAYRDFSGQRCNDEMMTLQACNVFCCTSPIFLKKKKSSPRFLLYFPYFSPKISVFSKKKKVFTQNRSLESKQTSASDRNCIYYFRLLFYFFYIFFKIIFLFFLYCIIIFFIKFLGMLGEYAPG